MNLQELHSGARLGRYSAWVRYSTGLALFGIALAARFALIDVLPARGFPFLTFFPAVMLTAYLAGLLPGLLISALSTFSAWYFFIDPTLSFARLPRGDAIALVFFSAILIVDCVVLQLMNSALARVRATGDKLRASEARVRQVLDTLFVYVGILDLDGRVLEINQAPLPSAGLRREDILGKPFWEVSWWSDAGEGHTLRRALVEAADGATVRYDAVIRGADSAPLTIDFQVAPLRDDSSGKITALIFSGVDVSQRVGALADLESSRAQAVAFAQRAEAERRILDAIFDAVPAAIIVADADGKIVRMNRATEQIWGHAPFSKNVEAYADWKGWWADGSVRQGLRIQAHEWGLSRALHGQTCAEVVEVEAFGRPGERKLTLLSAAPVVDATGEVQGAVVAQVDITLRMEAERALRESETKFRALADNIMQLAWMADRQGQVFWYNQQWFDYTGTTKESMATTHWRDFHHPDHLDRVCRLVEERLQVGEAWQATFPLRRHDGQYRWFLTQVLPVLDPHGHIERWFGTNTDITEQMTTQQALRESQERLLAREAVLEKADRQKDVFLATLAHELRNPLAPIRAAAQLIGMLAAHDDKIFRAAAVIDRQSSQLVRLVDDLLDVARINSGKLSLRRTNPDLRTVVDSALETCQPLIDRSGYHFTVTMPNKPVPVCVDETRIAQCVSNLVHNALKFTAPPGEISLTVAALADGWASIKVKDNGRGFSAEMLPKLFALFEQEGASGHEGNGGLGIGLALTRSLIEKHDGQIVARSPGPGKGAEFEILLPLAQVMSVPEDSAAPERPVHDAAVVLIVDDNRDSAEILKELLESEGFRVLTAHTGISAVDIIKNRRPNIVLLDIGLPDISGYEVARRTRADPSVNPDTLLVALTGWGDDESKAASVDAGIDHHISKPADTRLLLAVMRRHLAACAASL